MLSLVELSKLDPIKFGKIFWPDVTFYRQQEQIIRSVEENDETYAPAGNMLGKDFVAGFIVLRFFLTRHPCRIVTTSAKDDHLRVLWGEIGRFIQTAAYPLTADRGGPLIAKRQDIRKLVNGERCPISYVLGMVAGPDSIAAMQGHHVAATGDGIPRTLFVSDESSSVRDEYYMMATTWANRALVIGNPWPCENFFRRGVKAGDLKAPTNGHYYRKVIRIKAEDSPNVRYALAEIAGGRQPSHTIILPGVKPYTEYLKNRALWDKVQQCVSLDAEFYEGAENLLFPPEWLNRAERLAESLRGRPRAAKAIGIDPGEGGDKTAMAAVDELGLIELVSKKTPNTATITGEAVAFMRRHNVPSERVVFDRGGGGKEHADRLKAQGYPVRSVGFGETPTLTPRRGLTRVEDRIEKKAEQYAYKNLRAEMYGDLRRLLDPSRPDGGGFAIPAEYTELRRQLAPIPLWYDEEGRLMLPPKRRKPTDKEGTDKVTLDKLIGCSPDEADALVLACFGMMHRERKVVAGAL